MPLACSSIPPEQTSVFQKTDLEVRPTYLAAPSIQEITQLAGIRRGGYPSLLKMLEADPLHA